jgi:hypothetical protein
MPSPFPGHEPLHRVGTTPGTTSTRNSCPRSPSGSCRRSGPLTSSSSTSMSPSMNSRPSRGGSWGGRTWPSDGCRRRGPASRRGRPGGPGPGPIPTQDVERSDVPRNPGPPQPGVITVIELLSPSNKRTGPDREQYLPSERACWAVGPTSWKTTCSAAGGRCPWPIDPMLILGPGQPGRAVVLGRLVARSPSASGCPSSPSRCVPPTVMPGWTFRTCSTGSTTHPAMRLFYEGKPEPMLAPDETSWARQFLPRRIDLSLFRDPLPSSVPRITLRCLDLTDTS